MRIEIRIYSTEYCGYCRAAEALLKKKGVAFEAIDCTRDADVRRWLVDQTGRRTVPQVFIKGTPIGGYDELVKLETAGTLDAILAGDVQPISIA